MQSHAPNGRVDARTFQRINSKSSLKLRLLFPRVCHTLTVGPGCLSQHPT
jgi:hypothetical protein